MSEAAVINVFIQTHVYDQGEARVDQSYEDIRQVFRGAAEDEVAVRFVYDPLDPDAVRQIRTLTPSEFVGNGNGDESVIGHDHDRDYARRFRLDRVRAVEYAPDVEPYRA